MAKKARDRRGLRAVAKGREGSRSATFSVSGKIPAGAGNSPGICCRLDFLVARAVVLELKSTDTLRPVHEAQLLTYLRLGGWTVGLLMNFNVPALRDGIRRVVLNHKNPSAASAPLR
jgi:hypothetical protein